jgi:hypothetical protein
MLCPAALLNNKALGRNHVSQLQCSLYVQAVALLGFSGIPGPVITMAGPNINYKLRKNYSYLMGLLLFGEII